MWWMWCLCYMLENAWSGETYKKLPYSKIKVTLIQEFIMECIWEAKLKGQVSPVPEHHEMKAYREHGRKNEHIDLCSIWSALCSGHFTLKEEAPVTCWLGGWVDPRIC